MTRGEYESMSRDQLIARLNVAEDALVLIGWSSIPLGDGDTERSKASEQMWQTWCSMVGPDFCGPNRHLDLERLTPMLASTRDRIRADTLRRLGLEDGP